MEEINVAASNTEAVSKTNKSKNTIGIIIAIVSVFVFIIILAVALAGEETKEKYTISNVNLTTEYSEYLGYDAKITGTFKNVSGEDYSYVSVEYIVYDAAGNNLGTAIDNINNLQNGDTWNFEATLFSFSEVKPTSYKLVEVTCF